MALAIFFAGVSVAGALYLFGVQFADGSAYPRYSSLRSDPLGARLLFDTLALVPGTSVTRNYLPLEYVNGPDATVFLLNLPTGSLDTEQLALMDKLAARGVRVVTTLAEQENAPPDNGPLTGTWHVHLGFDDHAARDRRLWFTQSAGWTPIAQDGPKTLAMERAAGKGSIVLFADSSAFANGAFVDQSGAVVSTGLPLISTAIGPNSRIIFDEQHLGIEQTGSVVGLVRRFRLTGMALGLAICAALLIWRNVTGFPAPRATGRGARDAAGLPGRTSRSGFLTLLRRHVPPAELASVCWNEWLTANRRGIAPDTIVQAELAIRQTEEDPLNALRKVQSILNPKGTH
jgi:hypothetical protein